MTYQFSEPEFKNFSPVVRNGVMYSSHAQWRYACRFPDRKGSIYEAFDTSWRYGVNSDSNRGYYRISQDGEVVFGMIKAINSPASEYSKYLDNRPLSHIVKTVFSQEYAIANIQAFFRYKGAPTTVSRNCEMAVGETARQIEQLARRSMHVKCPSIPDLFKLFKQHQLPDNMSSVDVYMSKRKALRRELGLPIDH